MPCKNLDVITLITIVQNNDLNMQRFPYLVIPTHRVSRFDWYWGFDTKPGFSSTIDIKYQYQKKTRQIQPTNRCNPNTMMENKSPYSHNHKS
jgi:hypothetical protein